MERITKETSFTGKSGQDIIIHRYGEDDYSAWFTDDPGDDTSGCSVRGTLLDILEEIADELPARKITDRRATASANHPNLNEQADDQIKV